MDEGHDDEPIAEGFGLEWRAVLIQPTWRRGAWPEERVALAEPTLSRVAIGLGFADWEEGGQDKTQTRRHDLLRHRQHCGISDRNGRRTLQMLVGKD
ncbi:hypothetical protein [Methylobacterium sp. B4]|uniref:hypothetical protein n=1 Tax=Methylobacterium sp. B4 TaxID=1938755 RepID=UPI0011B6BD33|nr:hypothetical protein [Methylobacterium sp. B4]